MSTGTNHILPVKFLVPHLTQSQVFCRRTSTEQKYRKTNIPSHFFIMPYLPKSIKTKNLTYLFSFLHLSPISPDCHLSRSLCQLQFAGNSAWNRPKTVCFLLLFCISIFNLLTYTRSAHNLLDLKYFCENPRIDVMCHPSVEEMNITTVILDEISQFFYPGFRSTVGVLIFQMGTSKFEGFWLFHVQSLQ